MAGGFFRKAGIAIAAAGLVAATPAAAQHYSDASEFLKAAKERDGNKATSLLNEPGNTLINTKDNTTGETALHYAVERRDELWVKFLLERGANPNIADNNRETPLTIAAGLGFVEGVEQLIAKGARIDDTNSSGETPLISAVHRHDLAIVRLLLKKGADPDRPDNSGRSARDYARLMGASAGMIGEIERGEAERKQTGAAQDTYGPGI
jgi:hypothetical protein